MRRVLALLLVPAVIALTAEVSPRHVHAYSDHDHHEHHHGPAAHDHHAAAHEPDGLVHLEGCDPSRHEIWVSFLCSAPPEAPAIDAEAEPVAVPSSERHVLRAVEVTDVRVHGPPAPTKSSPRAPPFCPRLLT